jgi:hypothetical protein
MNRECACKENRRLHAVPEENQDRTGLGLCVDLFGVRQIGASGVSINLGSPEQTSDTLTSATNVPLSDGIARM